jgi:hypothetical protein
LEKGQFIGLIHFFQGRLGRPLTAADELVAQSSATLRQLADQLAQEAAP